MELLCTPRVASIRPLIGICLIVLSLHLPFLNQGFYMDDGPYPLLSGNVGYSPWLPEDIPPYFEGLQARDLASTKHTWSLTIYMLALCELISPGVAEAGMHLVFLAFPPMIGCLMYFLARRFCNHPVTAALSVLATPVACMLAYRLMTDIPMFALWVTSAALCCHGLDSYRSDLIWSGAILVTLACFMAYSGFCLIPLLCLFAALRATLKSMLPVLVLPVPAFTARLAQAYLHYHRLIPGRIAGSRGCAEISGTALVRREAITVPVVPFEFRLGAPKWTTTQWQHGWSGLTAPFPALSHS